VCWGNRWNKSGVTTKGAKSTKEKEEELIALVSFVLLVVSLDIF
jgi:hypothetical protein